MKEFTFDMKTVLVELSEADVSSLWVIRNRGVLSRIARKHEVSGRFVRMVYNGEVRSRRLRVEKSLIEAGAPFVANRIALNGAA